MGEPVQSRAFLSALSKKPYRENGSAVARQIKARPGDVLPENH